MKLNIHNVRLGFACNSSSSHSLIYLPPERMAGMQDYLVGDYKDHTEMIVEAKPNEEGGLDIIADDGCYDFGWERFVGVSENVKRHYVGLILLHNLQQICSKDIAALVASRWCGKNLTDPNDDPDIELGHIDHQSLTTLPRSWDGKGLEPGFVQAFLQYVMQPNLVILGGNDNLEEGETKHDLLDDPEAIPATLPIGEDSRNENLVARYDETYRYWTLYDRHTGHKVRMSFDRATQVDRASTPELVDIKITDKCPFDCAFCYQGSTQSGKHAKVSDLGTWAMHLADMKVFEVAIGGGEPTLHPDFLTILQSFRNYGIVPNFTTKNLSWLRDPKKWVPIMATIGAFAYSVDKVKEVEELATLLSFNGIQANDSGFHRVTLQYVMGSASEYEFSSILHMAKKYNLRITLLGYKTVGRGSEFTPHNYSTWIEDVRKVYESTYVPISIDTALAAEFEGQLLGAGVPPWLFHTTEGSYSMYVDAVAEEVAPSSYCSKEERVPVKLRYGSDFETELKNHFLGFYGWAAPVRKSRLEMLSDT